MTEVYPDYLLPKSHYQFINFNREDIFKVKCFLVRHTENQDNQDEFGNLHSKSVAFQTDHLHDYSTNLLGIFKCEDLKWKWLKGTNCTELWNLKDEAIIPILEQDVIIDEGRGAFYLNIHELHKKLFDLPAPIGDTEKVECLVLHTPTKSNFWHFSLRWIIKGEDTTNWEPKRRRKVLETARSVIIRNAIFEQPTLQVIPESHYTQHL